jgi:DMSO reductase iron-sulfur subunit
MTQLGFNFDANKCTGCNACQIACIIENQLDFSAHWRKVNTFNQIHHPSLPVFHLSLACNHCADPPCMNHCPALAYSKNPENGIVLLDEQKCIGCQYCSWICPYDAPLYLESKGIMSKCTLCNSRITEGTQPACVTLCPTDALQLGRFSDSPKTTAVPGFTQSDIGPAIQIIPLTPGRVIPEPAASSFSAEILDQWRSIPSSKKNKINLRSEWTLLLFTLLTPFLVALYSHNKIHGFMHAAWIPVFLGAFGMVISSFHLGKKLRAMRAVFNLKQSWLSREVFSYSALLILMVCSEVILPQIDFIWQMSIFFGFVTLVAADMIYQVLPQMSSKKMHSAQVVFSGLLYFALLSANILLCVVVLLVKSVLFIRRMTEKKTLLSSFSIFRISAGFILPALLLSLGWAPDHIIVWIFIVAAEISDRIDFYQQLEVITPVKQMAQDFQEAFSGAVDASSALRSK